MRRAMAAALLAVVCIAAGMPNVLAGNYFIYATGGESAKTPQNWGMGESRLGARSCKTRGISLF